jgi:cysteine desulfurase/selenocysteine lyase
MPRLVLQAVTRYGLELGGGVHRGQHLLSERVSQAYEEARQDVARSLGCAADEVIFVRNATEAITLCAHGLPWSPGDEVVLGHEAHHSNDLPWRRAARTVVVPLDDQGLWDLDHYADILKRRPKLVALTHVSNVTGIRQPLGRLVAMAKAAGSLVLVDASQSIPHERLNVDDLGVDFLAFSAHKLLGPTGIGVLFARRQMMRSMNAMAEGGGTVEWVDRATYRSREGPSRFEAGTPNIAGALGLAAALNYLDGLGWALVSEHDQMLSHLLYEGSKERKAYLSYFYPESTANRVALLSLCFNGNIPMNEIARILSNSFGIMCRSGHLCAQPIVDSFSTRGVLRASCYVYNNGNDVKRFFKALDVINEGLTTRTSRTKSYGQSPISL